MNEIQAKQSKVNDVSCVSVCVFVQRKQLARESELDIFRTISRNWVSLVERKTCATWDKYKRERERNAKTHAQTDSKLSLKLVVC